MDLLGGYGSDTGASSDDEPAAPVPRTTAAPSAAPAVSEPAAPRRTGGLLSGLPAPKAPSAAAAQLPAGFFDDEPVAAPVTTSAARPASAATAFPAFPAAAASSGRPLHNSTAAVEDDEEDAPALGPARPPGDAALMGASISDIPAPSNTKLWSKLPAPQAGKRKVVIKSSLNAALLAAKGSDSDDGDEKPAAKRAKTGTGSKGGSGLASFLPPPKNEVQMAAAGTSGRVKLGSGGSNGSGGFGGRAAAAASDGGASTSATQAEAADYANEAFRVGGAAAQNASQQYAYAAASDQYSVGGSGGVQYAPAAADPAEYEQYAANVQQQYYQPQQPRQQQAAAVAGGTSRGAVGAAGGGGSAGGGGDVSEDMLAAAMAEEAERVARRGGAGTGASIAASIQFKEVNASKLKHVDAARREAQQGMRAALGAEYAQTLRAQATPFAGDKLARRKHQIGTLFHNAKAQELEMLETKAAGMQSKAHTKQKYGW